MKNKAVKIGLTSLVLAITFGALLYTTMAEGTEYYKHVDEVMAQPDQWYGKKLQLHGFVVPNSINRNPKSMDYWFQVQSNGQIVTATYTGVVPDTFKSDSEVVLKGELPLPLNPPAGCRFHTRCPYVMDICRDVVPIFAPITPGPRQVGGAEITVTKEKKEPSKDDDVLTLSTVHSAKGMEWSAVHLIHAADGIFPADMSLSSNEGLEEERRLMYVAVTRARDVLTSRSMIAVCNSVKNACE